MTDKVLAQLTALKSATTPALREKWRKLFDGEPPGCGRKYLEARLAYRIQELAYGGLKPQTVTRLEALAAAVAPEGSRSKRAKASSRPISGTKFIREFRGVEHTVTVLADGFEWRGQSFKSLSPIANAITGTRWNGLVFFGLKSSRGRP